MESENNTLSQKLKQLGIDIDINNPHINEESNAITFFNLKELEGDNNEQK